MFQEDVAFLRKGMVMTKLSRNGKLNKTKVFLKQLKAKGDFAVVWESGSFFKSAEDSQGDFFFVGAICWFSIHFLYE